MIDIRESLNELMDYTKETVDLEDSLDKSRAHIYNLRNGKADWSLSLIERFGEAVLGLKPNEMFILVGMLCNKNGGARMERIDSFITAIKNRRELMENQKNV